MMKRMAFVLGVLAVLALPSAAMAEGWDGNGTQVYRFSDELREYEGTYHTSGEFPGPAATFGEDVDVHYESMNSSTVRIKGDDVKWTLTQHGTATVTALDDGEVLYSGPFQVEEVARDIGGDANCLWEDGQHAWAGNCDALKTKLDFLEYHWKITGASVYTFDASIKGQGNWCYSSTQGGEDGPGC
jgi:hypothetical protein